MQRPERRDRGKAEEDQEPNNLVQGCAQAGMFISLACSRRPENVEGIESRVLVDQQDAHQGHDGTGREERAPFHRGVFFAVAAKLKMKPTESRSLRPSGSVISKYFFVWLPHMPSSRYMGITDIS